MTKVIKFNEILQNTNAINHIDNLNDKVIFLILRDLKRLNWSINFENESIQILPPQYYDKKVIQYAMSIKRDEILSKYRSWIDRHINFAIENLADGYQVLNSKIKPIIEICETPKQHSLFRILRYYWSSPYSEYVGRRIKIIIRDSSLPNKPIIGIAALGSPIIHIPERDNFIGWDKETRTKYLNYTIDAYVIGALPPYNYLLGGKLISYILASKEIRKIYEKKYKNKKTIISKEKYNKLVGIFTTGLYGKSSQYNRLKYNDKLLYKPIGETKGFGTLHLSEETISEMQRLLKNNGILLSNKFGSGPSWVMRIIRAAGDILNFDSDFLLNHSFKRKIYFIPLAKNSIEFLNGKTKKPIYYNYSLNELITFWKNRWLMQRLKNEQVVFLVKNFKKEDFCASMSLTNE